MDTHELLSELRVRLEHRCARHWAELEVRAPKELPALHGNRELLLSALLALADNALEAMASGGLLELGVDLAAGGGAVAIEIADRGPGIDEKLLARVCEPFFTTKPRGAGLGLTIAQGRESI